jgi:hypothetical protein
MKDDLTPFCNTLCHHFVTLTFQDKDNIRTTSAKTQLMDVSFENKHEKSSPVIL